MRELLKLNEEQLLFFDIETAPLEKEITIDTPLYNSWYNKVNKDGTKDSKEVIESYYKEAGLYPEFSKIICIVIGVIHKGEILLRVLDQLKETDILNSFNETLNNPKNTKKILTGFSNIGFDTPFIFKRMLINGIKPNDKLDSSGLKPWEVEEIDLSKLWQSTSFTRASLLNIATVFNLPSPKDDISGSDITKVYFNNELNRIVEYCKSDVITTINIFRKMCLKESLVCNDKGVDTSKTPPLIEDLFNGGIYNNKYKTKLIKFLKGLDNSEQDRCFVLLDSVVSNAKGKITKFAKQDVKDLKSKTSE